MAILSDLNRLVSFNAPTLKWFIDNKGFPVSL